MDEKLIARFWAKVERHGPDECWEWRGARLGPGYGMIGVKHRPMLAHRFSWLIASGPIPEGMHVCHRCDNPPCVNPGHLFLGTARDNMADKVSKGRQRRGAAVVGSKYSEEIVREVRRLRAAGHSLKSIEAMTGVRWRIVSKIALGKCWRHVA